MSPATFRPFGDYMLLGEIARGGMGVVYSARRISLNKRVAIKMIHAGALASPAALHRFRTEAEAMARLDHPNIVPVYEVGAFEGQTYFSMKLIDGSSLAESMLEGAYRTHPGGFRGADKEPRPFYKGVALIAKLARAVHHAHARGVLHRDLKPSNVLIDADGEPHLTDFGIAKLLEEEGGQTQTVGLLGTPHYIAPEQAAGDVREITTAVDVYSLGAILYELITGRVPFEAASPLKVLQAVIDKPPQRPRALDDRIDRDLETICLKCLSKEPCHRYASAEHLALDLERWMRHEPVSARSLNIYETARLHCRRHPLTAALSAIVMLLIVAGMAGMALSLRHVNAARRQAETERSLATQHAAESRDRFSRLCVEHANRLLDSGDSVKALPWLVEGLALSSQDSAAERFQRIRLGFALNQYPQLREMSFLDARAARMDMSPDGRMLVAADRAGTVTLWDALSSHRMGSMAHTTVVDLVLFSPDNRQFAVALGRQDAPGRLEIWKVGAPPQLQQTFDRRVAYGALCFSATSGRLYCGLKDGGLECVEPQTGRVLWSRKPHTDSVESLSLSADQSQIATGSWDESVGVWDATDGHPIGPVLPVGGYVRSVRFTADGSRLVASSDDGVGRVFDAGPTHVLRTRLDHGDRIYRMEVSPDSRKAVTCGRDGSVKVWDLHTGQCLSTLIASGNTVEEALFTHDSQRVVTVSWGKSVGVWDASTGRRIGPLLLHFGAVIQARVTPDDEGLFTASTDQTLRHWRMPRTSDIEGWSQQYRGKIYAAGFSPDGQWVVSGGGDRFARVHASTNGAVIAATLQHSNAVESCGFSPGGETLFTASLDGWGRVWDAPGGALRFSMRRESSFAPSTASGFAFSPDSRWLATSEDADSLQVWDCVARKPIATQLKLPSYLLHATFSKTNGLLAISCGTRQELQPGWSLLFRVTEEGVQELHRMKHPRVVWESALSPNGARLATACADGVVRLWRTDTGDLIHDHIRHPDEAMHVGFSPDGHLLVSSGEDQSAQVWRVENGQQACPPIFLEGRVSAIFDPTGNLLGTTSRDGTARLWEIRQGQAVSPRFQGGGRVTAAAFSPDGHRFLIAGADGTLQMHPLRPNEESLERLRLWSIVLTGMRISPEGQAVTVSRSEIEDAWNRFRQN